MSVIQMNRGADVALPHSIEAEQQVLGSCIVSPEALEDALALLEPGDFYDPLHAEIFAELQERTRQNRRLTVEGLAAHFAEALADLGGPKYIVHICAVAMPMGAADLAADLRELAARRRAIDLADGLRARLMRTESTLDILQSAESQIGEITDKARRRPGNRSMLSVTTTALARANEVHMGTVPPGLPTGIRALDDKIKGLRGGQFILLGGRPAMGKTSILLNILRNIALGGRGVMHFSLEMSGEELWPRLVSMELQERGIRLPHQQIDAANELSETQMRDVIDASRAIAELPIKISERATRSATAIRSEAMKAARWFKDTTPLGAVAIDYVQLVEADGFSPYERASRVSDLCKSLAMDLDVPVIACAQLSRDLERRDDKRPAMSDLRESGKLEEDADKVIFAYRDEYYIQRKLESCTDEAIMADLRAALAATRNQVELIVSKQRNGPTGTARTFIDLATCAMMDRAPDSDPSLF